MDKSWILHHTRDSQEYYKGIRDFIQLAKRHTDRLNRTKCPCCQCKNTVYRPIEEVENHLFRHGMHREYTDWIWHGEARQTIGNVNTEPNVNGDISDDEDRNEDNVFELLDKKGTGWIHVDACKAFEDMVAQSSEASVNLDASSLVPEDEEILENCLGTAEGQYFCRFGYGKKGSSSSSSCTRKANAELEAERRRAEKAEQELDEMSGELSQVMESLNEMKATMDSMLQHQMMSSHFMSTQFSSYRPPFGSPQQQQPAFGSFGSQQYPLPPSASQQQNPMFGPYPPFHSQPPTE